MQKQMIFNAYLVEYLGEARVAALSTAEAEREGPVAAHHDSRRSWLGTAVLAAVVAMLLGSTSAESLQLASMAVWALAGMAFVGSLAVVRRALRAAGQAIERWQDARRAAAQDAAVWRMAQGDHRVMMDMLRARDRAEQ